MKKLILIDGNAIIHRAYHAIPPFKTSKGELINAVYGFASMLLNILNKEKPDYIAVSFDTKAKTFRHEQYDDYKATRVKAPDDFYEQIPKVYELVKAFRIPIFTVDGFEADDILATLATQAQKHPDLMTYIATGDMDMSQMVTQKVNLLVPAKGFTESDIRGPKEIEGKYGLHPKQIPDMKGLQGDNSDNIKGVPGVGPKTAKDLLQKFGNIEGIYKHLDEIPGKVGENLRAHEKDAIFSKRLATLIHTVDIKLNLDDCKTYDYDKNEIEKFFAALEFKSLISKLDKLNQRQKDHQENGENSSKNTQGCLF